MLGCVGAIVASCGSSETEPAPKNVVNTPNVPQNQENLGPLYFVVDSVRFPAQDESLGFDLDGVDNSDFLDADSCLRYDAAGGVDNQLGEILRFLEQSGIPIASDVQQQIAAGVVLIVIEIDQVQSLQDDADVTVRVHLAQAKSLELDDNNHFVPNQAVTLDATVPARRFSSAAISAGVLIAGPGSMQLRVPYKPDDADLVFLDVDVQDAMLQAVVSETKLTAGVGGGAISAEELLQQADTAGFGLLAEFPIQGAVADLSPLGDGCEEISVGFGLNAAAVRIEDAANDDEP